MKKIKIYFVDFFAGFRINENFIVSALQNRYEIVLDAKNPDYLFYSNAGDQHFQYPDAIKIYFTGENDVPDFTICDYGIGSSLLNFGDRYFRLPLYTLYAGYEDIIASVGNVGALRATPLQKQLYVQRKFCNFVYSNAQKADPVREAFFHRLSQYKKVDSGGKYLNNTGKPVADKIDFIKEYKFTIAFENSSLPGYTTEKLLDPMRVNSLPVYWGNPAVNQDFNTQSFVNVVDYSSMDEVITEIIRLDKDDEAYLEKLSQPWITKEQQVNYPAKLSGFLVHIMDLPLETAKRTTPYGYSGLYGRKQKIMHSIYNIPLIKQLLLHKN